MLFGFGRKAKKLDVEVKIASHSAPELVRSLLLDYDRSLESTLSDAPANGEGIRVNGVVVPVIRLPFAKLSSFFLELYDRSNHDFFGNELPACKLAWNRRFRSLGGRIECRKRLIELSSAHFEACGVAALGIVLIHEQIHLALFERRRPFGHTALFKQKSHAVGLPSIHHEMPLPQRMIKPRKFHVYECRCGIVIRSRRRFRLARACGACCKKHNRGRFDSRFTLRYSGVIVAAGGES